MTSTKVCPAQRFLTPSTFFNHNISSVTVRSEHRGSTVIKVLCYKSEGRWFDPTWCHWIFYWHRIFTIALWPWGWHSLWQKWVPGVFPGGKGGRCVRLTNLPPSCAVVMKSGNLRFLEPSGPAQACNGVALPLPFYCPFHLRSSHGRQSSRAYSSRTAWPLKMGPIGRYRSSLNVGNQLP